MDYIRAEGGKNWVCSMVPQGVVLCTVVASGSIKNGPVGALSWTGDGVTHGPFVCGI